MEVAWSREEVLRRIPHRPPFLLVDHVQWVEPRKQARGTRFLDPADPVFQGHFPGNPIFPGVLVLEALGQLGAVLFGEPVEEGQAPSSAGKFFARLDRVRFLRPARPGETLELQITVLKEFDGFVKATGEARIGEDLVASAELTFTTGE